MLDVSPATFLVVGLFFCFFFGGMWVVLGGISHRGGTCHA